jgi:iron complex outermembrane receptor protein
MRLTPERPKLRARVHGDARRAGQMATERKRLMKRTCSYVLLASWSIVLATAVVAAEAQQTAAAQQPASKDAKAGKDAEDKDKVKLVEEVTVTATKREESLQDIHIPVTPVSGEALSANKIATLEDLQFLVPNMTFGNDFNFAKTYIRGLGLSSSFHGVDPSVVLHVDGAVVSQASAYFASLFDVERIEVLRGPQSTLYGRNNTGGTINVITTKPGASRGGYLRMTAGGKDLNLMPEGGLDLPFSDKLLSRYAFRIQRRDGYGVNETSGNDIDDARQYAGRAQLRFVAGTTFDFLATGEYYREDDHAYALKFLGPSFPDNPPGFVALGTGGIAAGKRNIRARSGFEPSNFKETWYGTGAAKWQVSPKLTLRSITNYRELTTILFQDFTMSDTFVHRPLPLLPGQTSAIHDLEERGSQFSQEAQLVYDAGRVHGIFGAYYLREDVRGDNKIGHDPKNVSNDRLARVLLDGDLDVDAYAAFANLTLDVSSRVSLRLAGRYSDERRHLVNEFRSAGPGVATNLPNPAPPLPNSEAMPFDIIDGSWTDFSPEVGIDWRATDKVRAYFSYAEGFKSGNAEIGNNNPSFVEPEDVKNFEVGFKSTLAGNKLQLNIAAFSYELKNGQFNITLPIPTPPFFITTLRNAAAQDGKGVELDLRLRASERFRVDLATAYLDSEFTDFSSLDPIDPLVPRTPDPTRLPQQNLAGNRPRNSPKWQFNVNASYVYPLAAGGTLTFAGNVAYKDSQFYNEFNNPRIGADAYTMLDASVRYTSKAKKWTVDAWIKNIADELVVAGAFPISTSRTIGGTYLPPRRFGVTLGYSFGS